MVSSATLQYPTERLPGHLADLGYTLRCVGAIQHIEPPFCRVPAGRFIMGSDRKADHHAYGDECPQHDGQTAAFLIALYPVTVAEYACAVRQRVVPAPREFKAITWEQQLRSPSLPVTSLDWIDAVTYCVWLGELLDRPVRLPTEAEWEKAARGTDGRIYPWGNTWDPDLANTPDQGPGHLMPIGSYPDGASPYGAQDMVGNVWEWCSSLYEPYPYGPDDGREVLTLGADRIMRGGAWYCVPYNARAACRGLGYGGRYLGGGFRLVIAPAAGENDV